MTHISHHDDIPARRPNRAPTHPGVVLRETVVPATGLTVKALADVLQVTRQQLHRVMSEEAGISPEMALRLGKLCGNGPALWTRMQNNFDLWHARQRIGPELDAICTFSGIASLPDVPDLDDGAKLINAHMR